MSATVVNPLTLAEAAQIMREAYGERLPAKIRLDSDGCWGWQASKDGCGYGRFRAGDRNRVAHRLVYELLVAPLGDLTIDHLCRNRSCVNPAHMEAVPLRENIMRGTGVGVQNAQKTHCVHGHPFDSTNTGYKKDGARFCRECGRLATWRWKNRTK